MQKKNAASFYLVYGICKICLNTSRNYFIKYEENTVVCTCIWDIAILDAQPGLGTQPRYEVLGDLRVETKKSADINIGLMRLSPREWPNVDRG